MHSGERNIMDSFWANCHIILWKQWLVQVFGCLHLCLTKISISLFNFTSKVRNYISNIFQLWTNVHSFQQQCFFWWSSISSDTYVVCSNCLPCISFAQKTWQRLRNIDILHDAIPHPHDRVGHPMHVKVRIWHFFRWL